MSDLIITQISSKFSHIIVLLSDGTIRCWGDNSDGECTIPNSRIRGRKVIKVSAGNGISLALLEDNTAIGWGSKKKNTSGVIEIPEDIQGTIVNIEAGDDGICFFYYDPEIAIEKIVEDETRQKSMSKKTKGKTADRTISTTNEVRTNQTRRIYVKSNIPNNPVIPLENVKYINGNKDTSKVLFKDGRFGKMFRSNPHFHHEYNNVEQFSLSYLTTVLLSKNKRIVIDSDSVLYQILDNSILSNLVKDLTIPPGIQGHVVQVSTTPSHVVVILDDTSVAEWGEYVRIPDFNVGKSTKANIPKPPVVFNAKYIQTSILGTFVLLFNGKLLYWGIPASGIQNIPEELRAVPEDYERRMDPLIIQEINEQRIRAGLDELLQIIPTRPEIPLVQEIEEPGIPNRYLDELNRRITCPICLTNKVNISLVPCGHLMCESCYSDFRKKKIPVNCGVCNQIATDRHYLRLDTPAPHLLEDYSLSRTARSIRTTIPDPSAAAAAASSLPEETTNSVYAPEEYSDRRGRKGPAIKLPAEKEPAMKLPAGKENVFKVGPGDLSVQEEFIGPQIQGIVKPNDPILIPPSGQINPYINEVISEIKCPRCKTNTRNLILEPCKDTICNVCFEQLSEPKRCPHCLERITTAYPFIFGGSTNKDTYYKFKYLKYKSKYLKLKNAN